ncbi:MAG: acyl-CoA dehydrogenase family protein [Pseudomonadales bacterium]
MNFELAEEQVDVRALARKILEDYCSNEQMREFDSGERFDAKLWQELATAGLLGIEIAQEYGGMSFDFETLCLLMEEVGRTVAPVPVLHALAVGAHTVQRFGSEQLKRDVLPSVASGAETISSALAEAGSYSVMPASLRAEANNNGWLLNGEKSFVPFANRSKFLLVAAATVDGLALLVVNNDAAGLTMLEQTSTAGENQYCLQFSDCQVSNSYCLASGAEAYAVLQHVENAAIAASVSQMVGVCDVMMRLTASYTSEREQFGVKIATFQAVGQRAADCYIDVECLRLVAQRAVYAVEFGSDSEATEACAVAKIWAGDAGHRVSHAAQHLHGGMGVDRDYSLWRYCLWAKQLEHTFGNSAEQTERLGELLAQQFSAGAL